MRILLQIAYLSNRKRMMDEVLIKHGGGDGLVKCV